MKYVCFGSDLSVTQGPGQFEGLRFKLIVRYGELWPLRPGSEKEAISGSFQVTISDRIPVGPTTGTFWSGGLFPRRCLVRSGKANTPALGAMAMARPRDDVGFEIAVL